jgi:hypothetical protein
MNEETVIVRRDLARDIRDFLARFGAWDPEADILAGEIETVLAAPFDEAPPNEFDA